MKILQRLERVRRLFLDTAPIIYFVEEKAIRVPHGTVLKAESPKIADDVVIFFAIKP